MATYEIGMPDGSVYHVDAPEGTSHDAIVSAAQQHAQTDNGLPRVPFPEESKLNPSDVQGLSNAHTRGASSVGPIGAGLEGVGQGLTFGFEKELEGTARAIAKKAQGDQRPWGDIWNEAVAIPKARQDAAAVDQPAAYYGGDLASSMLVPGGLERIGIKSAIKAAAHDPSMLRRAWAATKEGMGYGAAQGAGHTDGGLVDRAEGAGVGAIGGGTIGGAVSPLMDIGSALATKIATPIRAAIMPRQVGKEKFAEALARDFGSSGGQGGISSALNRVNARVGSAATSPAGKEMMLADYGGENTRNLLRAAANMPNDEAQRLNRVLDVRQSFQPSAIERDLKAGMGTNENFYAATDDLAKRMEAAGQTVIQPALKTPTQMTLALQSVLNRPTMLELKDVVDKNIMNEGRNPATVPLTERIHRMKMELDDQIGTAVKAQRMGNKPQAGWDANTLTGLKQALLKNTHNEVYKAGLKMYATEAQLKRTAEDWHSDFFKMAPEEITRFLSDATISEPQKRMARLGATRAMVDRIDKGNVMRDRTESLFGSPDMQKRMTAVFPSNLDRRQFQKALTLRAKQSDTRKAVQGGPSTAKQLMQAQEAGQPIRAGVAVAHAATGRLEAVLNMIARQAQRFSGITPSTANAILKTAQQKGLGDMRPALIKAIVAAERNPKRRAALMQALTVEGAAGVGASQ